MPPGIKNRQEAAGVAGEQRTAVSVMLHHQRGDAETAGLQMKVVSFKSLSSPLSSAFEGRALPLRYCRVEEEDDTGTIAAAAGYWCTEVEPCVLEL